MNKLLLIWLEGLLAAALVIGWVVLNQSASTLHKELAKLPFEVIKLRPLLPAMLVLLEKIRFVSRFSGVFYRIQSSIQKGFGVHRSGEMTLLYIAEMAGYIWLLLTGGLVMAAISGGSMTWLVMGIALAILLPVGLFRDLQKKVHEREQDILLELPEFLNKIVLLVGAGETVQKAIVRCVQRKQGEAENHPLYKELFRMVREMENGYSFQQGLESFSKRCGVQEVSVFTTTVMLNFRRGGGEFGLALRDLSRTLWDKRKAVSRVRGEQASSKMVFPMVLIFVVVMVLVGTPAFMMMNM
ncbi:type II secretion system F family protein [Paenibacillus sp. PK4536]|uniref:type II secretion system F family protein n=1 Tax=Paenibacillus sp. PK4536 TaxID=3024576 RepID=UPI001FE0A0A7|nr:MULTISPECIES: type II secretion system F family protein [Paenibacillus]WIM37274.1 type II secretion system F family protein [Paenibacillus sp. PK4536]